MEQGYNLLNLLKGARIQSIRFKITSDGDFGRGGMVFSGCRCFWVRWGVMVMGFCFVPLGWSFQASGCQMDYCRVTTL